MQPPEALKQVMLPSETGRRRALSQGVALWAGFGILLLLIALVAYQASRSLGRLEDSNSRIRREYRRRDHLLDRLHSEVYVSSTFVRDYLFESASGAAGVQLAELEAVRREMTTDIESYGRDLPAEEATAFSTLRHELNAYWGALDPAFHWDAATRRNRADGFLQQELFPRRREVFTLADRIALLNEKQLDAAEAKVTELFSRFRSQIVTTAFVTIALGLMCALVSIRRALHLEEEAKARYREVAHARKELEMLSTRLVVAQEEERRTISRELHDEVGQSMAAILVELDNLAASAPDCNGAREQFAVARRMAGESVAAVRNIALLLRPSMLDDLGLVPALKWQAREISRRTGVKVKVAADSVSEDLPEALRTCIYRLVQEAANNSARHADATTVRVSVHQESALLRVTVEDNGVGFDTRSERGLGILGMEERVRQLGGVFRVNSEAGSGTTVSALLPLDPMGTVAGDTPYAASSNPTGR